MCVYVVLTFKCRLIVKHYLDYDRNFWIRFQHPRANCGTDKNTVISLIFGIVQCEKVCGAAPGKSLVWSVWLKKWVSKSSGGCHVPVVGIEVQVSEEIFHIATCNLIWYFCFTWKPDALTKTISVMRPGEDHPAGEPWKVLLNYMTVSFFFWPKKK